MQRKSSCYSPSDEFIWFIVLQTHSIPMASKRTKDGCKERRKDKNNLRIMKYCTRLISVLHCYLLLFYLGHFFPLVHISNVLMSGQQHPLAACLGNMEVIVNSPSFLFVYLVSFILSLAKINPITFTGDKVLEKSASKEDRIIFWCSEYLEVSAAVPSECMPVTFFPLAVELLFVHWIEY